VRLFLDANVIFTAAHNPSGRSSALFELASHGRCRLATSPHASAEAERNLRLKYPDAMGRFNVLLRLITTEGEAGPSDVAWALEERLPLKDAPVLAAAVACRADVLVTGDRAHFGHLLGRRVRNLHVLTPADALALVLGQERGR
jgi:predicted nucleic acid-binding protein